MEKLIERLESDRIKSLSGRPYSVATKGDIKKAIRKFWKWKDGENRTYPKLVEWIETYVPVTEIPAVSRVELDRMIACCANFRDKAVLMVLFDSGARVEELLNVRLKQEHVFWKDSIGCYMIRLEYSKTKPRTISLPLSTEAIRLWLDEHPDRENPQSQLFPLTYANLKRIVRRAGEKGIRRRVTPHMLRHSSATYYANRLKNPYKLCYRYGWTMASKEVNRYLDREGILEEETAQLVQTDQANKAERSSEVLNEELILLRESYQQMQATQESLKRELDDLKSGKGILSLLLSLNQSQSSPAEVIQRIQASASQVLKLPPPNDREEVAVGYSTSSS